MLIRRLNECQEIIAGDHTRLRELLHPGREYTFTGRYSLAYATVPAGMKTKRHRLKFSEVYYILEGNGEMHVGDEAELVQVGDAIEIPAGAVQWIHNIGLSELVFLCIVDPAWQALDEEVLE